MFFVNKTSFPSSSTAIKSASYSAKNCQCTFIALSILVKRKNYLDYNLIVPPKAIPFPTPWAIPPPEFGVRFNTNLSNNLPLMCLIIVGDTGSEDSNGVLLVLYNSPSSAWQRRRWTQNLPENAAHNWAVWPISHWERDSTVVRDPSHWVWLSTSRATLSDRTPIFVAIGISCVSK